MVTRLPRPPGRVRSCTMQARSILCLLLVIHGFTSPGYGDDPSRARADAWSVGADRHLLRRSRAIIRQAQP
jgi:hypothetical protein